MTVLSIRGKKVSIHEQRLQIQIGPRKTRQVRIASLLLMTGPITTPVTGAADLTSVQFKLFSLSKTLFWYNSVFREPGNVFEWL